MNDVNIILKELMVDWENIISTDFNPLIYALAINNDSAKAVEFRDMYHKLEFAMEGIIKTNYKGFSDSILSYNRFNENNKRSLECLGSIKQCVEKIRTENFGVDEILKEHRNVKNSLNKSVFCSSVNKVRELSKMYDEVTDVRLKSKYIIEALDLINNPEYLQISGIDEYKKLLIKKYQNVAEEVNVALDQFIFGDKAENLRYFDCVIMLGSLKVFDEYLQRRFRKRLFETLEGVILDGFKNKALDIEGICTEVGSKVEAVKDGMYVLIDKARAHFEINPDGENVLSVRNSGLRLSISASEVLRVIKHELGAFVTSYSRYNSFQHASFELNCVVDSLDYSREFGAQNRISERFVNAHSAIVDTQCEYVVVTAPSRDVAYFLQCSVRDAELREYLAERHRELNHGGALAREKRRIEDFLSGTLLEIRSIRGAKDAARAFQEDLRKNGALRKVLCDAICDAMAKKFRDFFASEVARDFQRSSKWSIEKIQGFVRSEEFRAFLLSKAIPQKDLLLSKGRYQSLLCVIYFLREMDSVLVSREVEHVSRLYLSSFVVVLQLEFMYYFDLLYREGNARSNINAMSGIFANIFDLCGDCTDFELFPSLYENVEYYAVNNVASMAVNSPGDLEEFLENLQILDEMVGVMLPGQSLNKLRDFLKGVLGGTESSEKGEILRRKLGI